VVEAPGSVAGRPFREVEPAVGLVRVAAGGGFAQPCRPGVTDQLGDQFGDGRGLRWVDRYDRTATSAWSSRSMVTVVKAPSCVHAADAREGFLRVVDFGDLFDNLAGDDSPTTFCSSGVWSRTRSRTVCRGRGAWWNTSPRM
jgi:hypothetical protein